MVDAVEVRIAVGRDDGGGRRYAVGGMREVGTGGWWGTDKEKVGAGWQRRRLV